MADPPVSERDFRHHDLSKRGSQPSSFCATSYAGGTKVVPWGYTRLLGKLEKSVRAITVSNYAFRVVCNGMPYATDSTGTISSSSVSGAMSCSFGQVTAPNRMPTWLKYEAADFCD